MDLLINIFKEITDISDFLKSDYGMEGVNLTERIKFINGYHARLPEIVATAESILLNAKARASEEVMEDNPKINATLLKIKIEDKCHREIKALRYAERLEAACVHQMDGLRSQLSYLKYQSDN